VNVDADKDRFAAQKDILASKALRDIHRADGACKRALDRISLPAMFLKEGCYAVPVPNIERAEEILTAHKERRNGPLMAALREEYPERIEEARRVLGSLFNEADYPSVDGLASAFAMRWRWMAVQVPEALETLSESIYQNEREKMRRETAEVLEDWRVLLREEMRELCAKLAGKLMPGETFRDTTVTNVSQWLDEFEARNVADDGELRELAGQARLLLKGIKPDTLRDDERVRGAVREGFALIGASIETTPRSRKFSFGEED
jgi:hypothetical protein